MDYFSKQILLPQGWKYDVRFSVNNAGEFTKFKENASPAGASVIEGIVVPGMPNLHSHAFQRAMAGMSEFAVVGENNFWSWRKTMYKLANVITPEQIRIVAAQLYMEMVKAGYTSVAEFHYLHHDLNGKPYAAVDETCSQLIEAARESGIGLSLLPVLYMSADMSGQAPAAEQARFVHDIDSYIALFESLLDKQSEQLRAGMAFHSLRAVPIDALLTINEYYSQSFADHPLHIHIAEQRKELEECLQVYGSTPVQTLFDQVDVNQNWCLVHGTHVSDEEITLMATSDCVVGLCPTTEANLGDGIFPLQSFLAKGGSFGIGSDSHISVSPVEELRWLEYAQRLSLQQRNVAADESEAHSGSRLWEAALKGGAAALGRKVGSIEAGHRADLLVLDDSHPLLYAKAPEHVLDSLIFAGNTNLLKDVMVGGTWQVKDGRHEQEQDITFAFNKVMHELMNKL